MSSSLLFLSQSAQIQPCHTKIERARREFTRNLEQNYSIDSDQNTTKIKWHYGFKFDQNKTFSTVSRTVMSRDVNESSFFKLIHFKFLKLENGQNGRRSLRRRGDYELLRLLVKKLKQTLETNSNYLLIFRIMT